MSSRTTNLGLYLLGDSDTDNNVTIGEYRKQMAGEIATSNMQIIDEAYGTLVVDGDDTDTALSAVETAIATIRHDLIEIYEDLDAIKKIISSAEGSTTYFTDELPKIAAACGDCEDMVDEATEITDDAVDAVSALDIIYDAAIDNIDSANDKITGANEDMTTARTYEETSATDILASESAIRQSESILDEADDILAEVGIEKEDGTMEYVTVAQAIAKANQNTATANSIKSTASTDISTAQNETSEALVDITNALNDIADAEAADKLVFYHNGTKNVTGVLPVSKGGTGTTSLASFCTTLKTGMTDRDNLQWDEDNSTMTIMWPLGNTSEEGFYCDNTMHGDSPTDSVCIGTAGNGFEIFGTYAGTTYGALVLGNCVVYNGVAYNTMMNPVPFYTVSYYYTISRAGQYINRLFTHG